MIGVVLYKLLDLLSFIILAECLMTWVPGLTNTKLYYNVCKITEPIQGPIRNVLYKYMNSPIDITPIISLFLIRFAQRAVLGIF